jgi:hypothetical protein
MTWLTPGLSKRVQILIPNMQPNDEGGSDLVFGNPASEAFNFNEFDQLAPVLTIWMSMKPVTSKGSGAKYIRGEQVNEVITHEFSCRNIAVAMLGREFASSFSIAFRFMPNLVGLKNDYFLFVQNSSAMKGRLFRIHDVTDNKEQKEYLLISAEEIEERGVGWPA